MMNMEKELTLVGCDIIGENLDSFIIVSTGYLAMGIQSPPKVWKWPHWARVNLTRILNIDVN